MSICKLHFFNSTYFQWVISSETFFLKHIFFRLWNMLGIHVFFYYQFKYWRNSTTMGKITFAQEFSQNFHYRFAFSYFITIYIVVLSLWCLAASSQGQQVKTSILANFWSTSILAKTHFNFTTFTVILCNLPFN